MEQLTCTIEKLENGVFTIHSMGTINNSYEQAVQLCYMTKKEVKFKHNDTLVHIKYEHLKHPDDKIAATLYRLNLRV